MRTRGRLWVAILVGCALPPLAATAQTDDRPANACREGYGNATLEVTEETLNRLVDRLGVPSDSGGYTPPVGLPTREFKFCHVVGSIPCPGLPGRDLGFDGQSLPLAVCETHGGGILISPAAQPIVWQWWVTDAAFELKNGSASFSATVRSRIGDNVNVVTRTAGASVVFDPATNRLAIDIANFKVPVEYHGKTAEEVDVARLYALSIPVEPQQISVPMVSGPPKTVESSATRIDPIYRAGNVLVCVDMGF